eukprot:3905163-Heterocapsa_arctica.AAC.1
MPVSYLQHTSGFIPGFISRFHTPSMPLVSYLVSYPFSYRIHTCFIPGFDTAYLRFHAGFIPRFQTCGFTPVVSYRFHGVHPWAA